MKVRKVMVAVLTSMLLFSASSLSLAAEKNKTILFHLKTSLKHDDAQICVAYNMIWAALESGLEVDVLIDADAANTFKTGWLGRDDIEKFPLPERLRKSLSGQFKVPLNDVPGNYGRFLDMLHKKGARFHINSAFLVLAKIEKEMGKVDNISAKFFKPVTLNEMLRLRTSSDYYIAY